MAEAEHGCPIACFGAHTPAPQALPAEQPVLEVQLVGQSGPVLHRYGPQPGIPGVPARLVHRPIEPGMLQALHDPTQALVQQTPSTQFPELHSEPAVQATASVASYSSAERRTAPTA